MERSERINRLKRGAIYGTSASLLVSIGALIYTINNNPIEFAREYSHNPNEFLETIGTLITVHTILWTGLGAVMDGYVIPTIDNTLDQLNNWLENKTKKP